MTRSLPREWGEPGALRVSDISSERKRKTGIRPEAQQWLRDQQAHQLIDIGSRQLRALNQKRFNAARMRNLRPARVS